MRPSSPSLALVAGVAALAAAAAAQRPSLDDHAPVRALYVGTAHPVATAPVTDAVIVVQGERITAIGKAGDVEVPADAEVLRFPTAHAYPGLVDAISTAFGDAYVLGDNSSDAGTEVFAGLDAYDDTSRTLTRFGVTTIAISNRGETTWRGLGAVVHPTKTGFVPANRERAAAFAEYLRISGGAESVHPLDRQRALRAVDKPFTELDDYERTKSKHAADLAEYEKKYAEYLDHFRKKAAPGERDAPPEAAQAPSPDAEKEPREHREQRGEADGEKPAKKDGEQPGEQKGEQKDEQKDEMGADGKAAAERQPAANEPASPAPAKAPAKPEFPKPFAVDPAREALLKVRRGELPLHVEARRPEEIRAALELAREYALKLVLEVASEAGDLAPEIAAAGVPVVAAGFCSWVASGGAADSPLPSFTGDLPARLARAGVEVAIASLSPREARALPLLAAYACGQGMDADAAVAAITLTPAKILGVADTVGSLEAGKRADVLVCSGPLLASDTRIVEVLAGGEPQIEKR
jgi:imidazolonepropionase-like amidohydrolase